MGKLIKLLFLFLCINIFLIACSNSKTTDDKLGDADHKMELTNLSKVVNNENIDLDQTIIEFKKGLQDDKLIISEQDTYNYKNLEINIKEETLLLFCMDPVYDISYYVNYGNDYFIYRIKNGKSELVVEMPAKRLFCIEGKLYFILESYQLYKFKDMTNGNILSYDPVSGEVSIVCDVEAETMSVYDDGIYYRTIKNYIQRDDGKFSIDRGFYYYSFATQKVEEITDIDKHHIKWKDYFITSEPDFTKTNSNGITDTIALKLETLDKAKSIKLLDKWGFGNYAIADNVCYYFYGNNFIQHNLDTNEVIKVPFFSELSHNDFTISNGMIYLASLYQYNPDSGILSGISPENENESIYELYTDGINLYGICGIGGIKQGIIRRIEIKPIHNGIIMNIQRDGIQFESNRLMYQSLPIGEE